MGKNGCLPNKIDTQEAESSSLTWLLRSKLILTPIKIAGEKGFGNNSLI